MLNWHSFPYYGHISIEYITKNHHKSVGFIPISPVSIHFLQPRGASPQEVSGFQGESHPRKVAPAFLLVFISGWWFGTFYIFPDIGNNHSHWLIFFRGVETTNQICFYCVQIDAFLDFWDEIYGFLWLFLGMISWVSSGIHWISEPFWMTCF